MGRVLEGAERDESLKHFGDNILAIESEPTEFTKEIREELDRLTTELKAKDASLEASRKLVRMKDEVITAQAGSLKTRNEALIEYGTHGRSSDTTMCERDKHSDYPCTCGFEQALKGNQ